MTNPLRYDGYYIAFQEVPDEVSLVFNITGCPHHCNGCHSSHLSNYYGEYLSSNIFDIIDKYDGLISCVCFMGGDQGIKELAEISKQIKDKYKLRVCMYFGCDTLDEVLSYISFVDYIKVGPYKEEFGGLDSSATNQRFYKLSSCGLEDWTYKFLKSY